MAPPLGMGLHRNSANWLLHQWTELSFVIIILAICVLVYFKTKELYDLSSHKGIGFFRQTILFFGLAYLLRLIPFFFQLSEIHLNEIRSFFMIGFLLFAYVSSMAVISLFRSVTYKHFEKSIFKKDWPYHAFAFLISLSIFVSGSLLYFLGTQILLMMVAFVALFVHKRKKNSFSYFSYGLLAVFWVLSLFILLVPRFLFEVKLMLYTVSIILFIGVLVVVLKRLKS